MSVSRFLTLKKVRETCFPFSSSRNFLCFVHNLQKNTYRHIIQSLIDFNNCQQTLTRAFYFSFFPSTFMVLNFNDNHFYHTPFSAILLPLFRLNVIKIFDQDISRVHFIIPTSRLDGCHSFLLSLKPDIFNISNMVPLRIFSRSVTLKSVKWD